MSTSDTPVRASDRLQSHAHTIELDVRDDLRNGREPFSRIMAAVAALGGAEVLHLRATFEPVPLFAVMEKRGFAHHAEQHGPEDWSVWFYRPEALSTDHAASSDTHSAGEPAQPAAAQKELGGETSKTQEKRPEEVWLDVRGLEPPEPMVRTLEALEELPPESVLVQINVRVPQFLLPILRERGFDFEIDESHSDQVQVRIWRASPTTLLSKEPRMSQHSTPQQSNTPSSSALPIELDARPIPPREKHPTIFRTFDSLAPGQSMLLINDHDPRPLRYQLAAERPDSFEWTYQEEGPEVWRVRIDRK